MSTCGVLEMQARVEIDELVLLTGADHGSAENWAFVWSFQHVPPVVLDDSVWWYVELEARSAIAS